MKKIILLIIISIIMSIFGFFVYKFINYVKNFKYQEIEYDYYLSNYQFTIINRILSNLKYNVQIKEFPYKKEKYDIIISQIPINENNIYIWRKWVSKDKRLILFYNRIYDEKTRKFVENEYVENKLKFITVNINSNKPLLKDINNLYISNSNQLNINDREIFENKIDPVLKSGNRIIIGKEKINDGEIIFISDPYIFSDKSILKPDNAVFLNNLLQDYYNKPIILDYVVELKKTTVPIKNPYFLFMGNFKFLLMQIILLIIIFILTFVKRFGTVIDKEKFERRSLIRHLEAVGYFLEKSKNPFTFISILDKYFIYRLQNIIKIRYLQKNNIINEIKKRYQIKPEEENIFDLNNEKNIVQRENKREKFIKKLKGV